MTAEESGENGGARWRCVVAAVLIALGCLTAIPATCAVWLDSVVNDTDGYVDTVAPLAADPAIQDAVTERITTAIEDAGPLGAGVAGRVEEHVADAVAGDRFATAWTQANRAAHARVVDLLTSDDDDRAVAVRDDTVRLQFGDIIADVPLADRLPDVDADIVVLQSEHLPAAREWLARIDRLGLWLPVAATVSVVAGVAVSRRRRRAIAMAGGGLALSMVLLMILLELARGRYADALPPTMDAEAAAAFFDRFADTLRSTALIPLVAGLATALVAFIAHRVAR